MGPRLLTGNNFGEFFSGGFVVFAGVFCEKWLVDVVFLWTACGGTAGKGGEKTARFRTRSFLQDFEIYF